MYKLLFFIVLAIPLHEAAITTCTDQQKCIQWAVTPLTDTKCGGPCDIQVCVTVKYNKAGCAKDGTTGNRISHVCGGGYKGKCDVFSPATTTPFTPTNGLTNDELAGFKKNDPPQDYEICLVGKPGSQLLFAVKDGSGCTTTTSSPFSITTATGIIVPGDCQAKNYTVAKKPEDIVAPSNGQVSVGGCTGEGSDIKECIYTITVPSNIDCPPNPPKPDCPDLNGYSDSYIVSSNDVPGCDFESAKRIVRTKDCQPAGPECERTLICTHTADILEIENLRECKELDAPRQ